MSENNTLNEFFTGWFGTLEKGLEKGLAKGLEKGIAQGKADTARAMKADGMAPELIAKYTGLTAEEIAKL